MACEDIYSNVLKQHNIFHITYSNRYANVDLVKNKLCRKLTANVSMHDVGNSCTDPGVGLIIIKEIITVKSMCL